MAKKKENTKEPDKGFIAIGFKSFVSGDMDFLQDDLDEDPDNPYLNWVLEKNSPLKGRWDTRQPSDLIPEIKFLHREHIQVYWHDGKLTWSDRRPH